MSETSGRQQSAQRWPVFEWILSGLNSIGTLWIFALMIIINLDVVGRTAFNAPLPGVLELVRLSIVGIVFIQLGHTFRAGRITRSDTLLRRLQTRWPRLGYGLDACFSLLAIFVFAVIFRASIPFFQHSWTTGEYVGIEGYITFPVWPVRLLILVGCAMAAIQFVLFLWRDVAVAAGFTEPGEELAGGDETTLYGPER